MEHSIHVHIDQVVEILQPHHNKHPSQRVKSRSHSRVSGKGRSSNLHRQCLHMLQRSSAVLASHESISFSNASALAANIRAQAFAILANDLQIGCLATFQSKALCTSDPWGCLKLESSCQKAQEAQKRSTEV
jgi:hypothetical protein